MCKSIMRGLNYERVVLAESIGDYESLHGYQAVYDMSVNNLVRL